MNHNNNNGVGRHPPRPHLSSQHGQQQQNYHHQINQMTEETGPTDSNLHLIYVDQQQQQQQVMSSAPQIVAPPPPPSSWVKPTISDDSNYGASYSQTFTKEEEQQQQQCPYSDGSYHRVTPPDYVNNTSFYTSHEHPPTGGGGDYYHPHQQHPQQQSCPPEFQQDDNYYGSTSWGQSTTSCSVDYNVNEQHQCSSERYTNQGFNCTAAAGRMTPSYDPLMGGGGGPCSSPHLVQNHGDYQQQQQQKQVAHRRNSLDSYGGGGHHGSTSLLEATDSYGGGGGPSYCGGQFNNPTMMIKREGWNSSPGAEGDYYYGGQQQRHFSPNFSSNSCRMAAAPSNHYYNSHRGVQPGRQLRQCNSFDQPATATTRVGTCPPSLKPAPVKMRSLSLQYSSTTPPISCTYEPHFEIPEIDPPLQRESSPPSSSVGGSTGSESESDSEEPCNLYPPGGECSTTTTAISDSVMTLHAGDPTDADNDNCYSSPPQFDGGQQNEFITIGVKTEDLTEPTSSCMQFHGGNLNETGFLIQVKSQVEDGKTGDETPSTTARGGNSKTQANVTSTTKSEPESTSKLRDDPFKNGESETSESLVDRANANLARFQQIISEGAICEYDNESSCSLSCRPKTAPPRQKVIKRSLSEGDKEGGAATSTKSLTIGVGLELSGHMNKEVSIPVGWSRETISTTLGDDCGDSKQQPTNSVIYVSPSGTRLHSMNELKHYIASDGTCKCGLGCPVRVERVFNFDPKVPNSTQTPSFDHLLSLEDADRFSCNHNKRRLSQVGVRAPPLSSIKENSPLISSTREDLGDHEVEDGLGIKSGSSAKKRRTDKLETKSDKMTKTITIPDAVSNRGVVPLSQQSPDTTTKTPQPSTSPTSSTSSEPSNRSSTNSTPTGPTSTKPSPSSTSPSWSAQSSTASLVQLAPQVWAAAATNKNEKKHKVVTSGKKTEPCPNIDVREMQLGEGGRRPEPQQPSQRSTPANGDKPPPVTLTEPPTTTGEGSQGPTPNALHLPTTTTTAATPTSQTTLPSYSLCPLIPNNNNTVPLQLANILPIQFPFQQRVLPTQLQGLCGEALILQQQGATATTTSNMGSSTATATTGSGEPQKPRETKPVVDSDKSPLEKVEDVVNRVHTKPLSESLATNFNGANQNGGGGGKEEGGQIADAAGLIIPSPILINTSTGVTTSSASTPIMATGPGIISPSTAGTLTLNTLQQQGAGNHLILQQSNSQPHLRYPFFSTAGQMQPIFLNQTGGGQNLIISPQPQQSTQPDPNFLQFDPSTGQLTPTQNPDLYQQMLLLDPLNNLIGGAARKKKKRPSKKQLQQQAQLQLQQQLILQQIQQQVQAQAQNMMILPQFQIGGQLGGQLTGGSFSLQPMNYYQAPTILTLPNIILNPADGTLFIQQAAATSSGLKFPAQFPPIVNQSSIAPKKEADKSTESISSDDARHQQNATPDSSTNDVFVSATTPSVLPHQLGGGISPGGSTVKKTKTKAVSSSSTAAQKRILPQKQILPKIDSTTTTGAGADGN